MHFKSKCLISFAALMILWGFTIEAAVAAPTFVAAGAVSSGTGAITPALPSGIAVNDILLLSLETANQAISISNQNGGTWTAVTNSPQGTGTAGGSSATRLTVFWSRYNGTQGNPTTSDSGNHQVGRMIAIRGCPTSGNPWDVTAGGVESTSDTSGAIPGATTTVADTLVVAAIATSLPDASGTANFSAWANSNLTSVTERTDNTVTSGNGGGLGIATGVKATAGAYGNTTVTAASSAVKGMMSIALKAAAGAPPGQASGPNPSNGATGVATTADLSWTAGSGATSHDVYFGTANPPPFVVNQTGTTYDTGTMTTSTTYYWRIDEKNANGTTTGIVWSFTTTSGPAPGNGTGLTGDYYDNMDLTGLVLSRTDATVNFDWGSGSPDPAIGADTFSVVWSGDVQPLYSETYTFYTTSDDGVRLWVNGQLIINNWTDHGSTVDSNTITLTAGTKYDIEMNYYENGGGAVAKLEWSSASQARQIIPQTQLYPITADASITQTATAPTIDGTVDSAWSAATAYSISHITVGTVSGDSDLSGNWKAMWDSSKLYYLVQMTDESLRNDSTDAWDDDSVEIFIDADNSKGTSYDGVNDFQYVFRWNDGTIHLGSNSATNTTGIVFSMVAVTGGYNLEISIPWSTLGVTPSQGNLIGTDVQVDDDDDGGARDGKKAWFATDDNSWQNPSLFATAKLAAGGGPQPPGQASNPSPANGATSVSTTADLSWTAGSGATSHDIYFGTAATPPFVVNQTGTTYDTSTMANSTTYYWRIDEKNTSGTTTGVVWSFTTTGVAPGQASNPSPTNGATSVSTTADLSWTAGSGATSHDVYFGTASPGTFRGNQAGTTYDTGTMANSTMYYWRIDEKNASGTTTGTVWSFTTQAVAAPGQASNPSPTNGATGVSTTADLSWTAGSGATSHDVYFGTASPGTFRGNQAGTTYDTGTMTNSTTYYWRIDEKNAGGTTTGAVWSFTTAGAGGQTTLNPTADASSQSGNCDTGSLSFSLWNHIFMKFDLASVPTPVTSAVLRLYYESAQALTIYVNDASSDTWTECGTLPTQGSTQMASASATGAGWYEFTVTSYVAAQATGDDVITFCISNSHSNWWSMCAREGANPPQLVVQYGGGGPPGQATNPSPANGATSVSTTTDLSWTAGSGATSHDVYFGTVSPGTFRGNQAGTTYDTGTMANGTTYYWRIDEKNANGTTTGIVWSFTTAAAVPPGQASSPSPANGATGVSTSVTVSWTAGSGATSHDVYFGTATTPPFIQNQAGTTYNPGALAYNTTYRWRIDEKNAYGTTTGVVWSFTTVVSAPAGMTVGCNFWRIDWGNGGWNHYFASGVNWATTTNPWNPTFVSELQESKMKCLRFMDWVITNGSAVTSWSQRIPKTANHYYAGNTVPLLNSDGSSAGNGYGVAYEWQIDLCNRIGADIWVTVPHAANADYQTQLATLLYNNLNSNLKVYVEYSNECWNWGFYQTTYCDLQSTAVGIRNLDVGAYAEPWWKYKIYASVRLFERFESVFGVNSPRLVKVIGCQVGYNWGGYDYNHQIIGELACLNNSTINPNGTMPNAWAAAPYWGTSVGDIGNLMLWAHNSLVGTGIKLICYEGGSDNYSDPRGCTTAQVDPAQEQLYINALNAIEPYCEGVFNQYCFVGDCWGLKVSTGQAPSAAPKWRGATTWINARY